MTVRPIPGTPFRYYCSSESGGEDKLVDWLDSPPTCTCRDWATRQRKHRQTTGQPYLCKHLREARDQQFQEIIEHTKSTLGL